MGRIDPAAIRTQDDLTRQLRALYASQGWSRHRLADAASLSSATVQAILNGRTHLPHTKTVRAFVEACGLDPEPWIAARGRIVAAETVARRGERLQPPPRAGADESPAHRVLNGLPADIATFTGRDTELRQLVDSVTGGTGDATVTRIHTIGGMAGIGKTALVVRAAHMLAERFPDGQIFLSLDAHAADRLPVDPSEALATLLLARGFRPDQIPPGPQARGALWRDHLAGSKALLVLDDVASTGQVEPLLPGTPDVLVLITSRRTLQALPGAVPVALGTLQRDEAVLLFGRLAARPTDQGPHDPDDAARIVALCGHLPLAIALTAGRLKYKPPSWTAAHVVDELTVAQDRLSWMQAEDRSVSVAFDLSHRALPPELQGLLTLMGLHPGPEIDAYAAAALTGTAPAAAADHLGRLGDHHLVSEPVRGRYGLHDLIRLYARARADRCPADERATALERLSDYYQQTARAADTFLLRHSRPGGPYPARLPAAAAPGLPDRAAALAWLRAERANLLAVLAHATAHGDDRRRIGLTAALAGFLRQEGPWEEAAVLHERAITAADHRGDLPALAEARRELGILRRRTGRYAEAADLHEQAHDIYLRLGDRLGQAHTLHHLSLVHRRTGHHEEAADLLERSHAIYQELGDRPGQAHTLDDLGVALRMQGRHSAAAALHGQAGDIYRALDDTLGQAHTLHHLGVVHRLMGNHATATALHEHAGGLYGQLGDRHGQAHALHDAGAVCRLERNHTAAVTLYEQAIELYRQLGDHHARARALHDIGLIRRAEGEHAAAATAHEQAIRLFRQVGDGRGEDDARGALAAIRAEEPGPTGAAHGA
ncbi:XRE family transcriptional regulator [Streptomyces arboris]|uniref:XRE family transcriptional regulator n=1 Tax=Streptomyces arboris TaxID=2600619 RepID=UPI00178C2C07|nr:XRE family transcriptional regulator [Streptomyces arboris]